VRRYTGLIQSHSRESQVFAARDAEMTLSFRRDGRQRLHCQTKTQKRQAGAIAARKATKAQMQAAAIQPPFSEANHAR
jgi:hypothetical protein